MGGQGLVQKFDGGVLVVGQAPEEGEHLLGHDAVLVVLGESPDELEQFFPLFGWGRGPAVLEAVKEMIQLVGGEVPGQSGQ